MGLANRYLGLCSIARVAILLPVLSAFGHAQPQQGQNGISVEHHRRLFPPAPTNIRAEIRDGAVVVSWDKPTPPPGRVGYDPIVARYRLYRISGIIDRRLVGETADTSFVDRTALRAGTMRRYAVTAIQRSGLESALSAEAELQVPAKRR